MWRKLYNRPLLVQFYHKTNPLLINIILAGHLHLLKRSLNLTSGKLDLRLLQLSAVSGGQQEILQWIKESSSKGLNRCSYALCAEAAKRGHFVVLRWLRENGVWWNEDTCSSAALGGHFEILKWAREQGCHWNSQTCAAAAQGGHLEILKWARENQCGWDFRM
jgi:hypothetical protein